MSSFSERARATKLAESTVTHDEELKVTQGDDSLGNLGLGPSKLQQNFNVWSLGFMAFCTSVTWEAVSSAMAQGMSTGGTSSLVWGFVLCATGAMLVIACLADYVSMIPTAGGQHHYVFELAPPKFRRILSWYVGWLTMLGWVLCALAGNFATAMQFQSWAILFSQNYAYERWHTTMIAWLVGLLTPAIGLVGWDSSIHMAEDSKDAATILPKSLLVSMISTVIATFPWIIAVAFCITDIPGVVTGPAGSISFMSQLFYNVSGGSQAATVGLTMFLPVMGFCGVGPSIISATSRIIWSFARDGGLPKAVSTVSDQTKTPIWALFITWLSICALSCVYIGNATAYYGLSSACTVTLMISYASPLLLNVMFGFQYCSIPRGRFPLGRWHRPMAMAGCAWSLCLIVMMCFPTVQPIRLENMNYASVVTVGGIVAATVCWFLYGRKQYIGLVQITDGVPTS
ncbi:hypothetical protein E8E14_012562 [Neopestalotiopsis sp. 37M]|nr:hypothetical protein E8E14_012562 [Neopestalotiopsis sp. 37M]